MHVFKHIHIHKLIIISPFTSLHAQIASKLTRICISQHALVENVFIKKLIATANQNEFLIVLVIAS